MTKPTDDLSQDPFKSDDLPKDQTFSDNVRDVLIDEAKEAAGNYAREAPKRMVRRTIWSVILSFGMADEWEKRRLLNRVENGGSISLHEALFGSKFTIWGTIRSVIFLVIVLGVIFYLWQQGFIEQIMQQQELIESLQQTQTP